ncbi:hypothetical protein SIM34_22385, partial [Bacillus cereus group sp. BfR-BA-02138]|nr:hypothetical protein [Bacillus cereus group sp. BfR-BA-02138]
VYIERCTYGSEESTWKPNVETHQGAGCLSYKEGGKGAHIEYISPADNRGAGSWVGNKLDKYPDGTRVKFDVK